MIGSGTPSSQSNAPFPKSMVILLHFQIGRRAVNAKAPGISALISRNEGALVLVANTSLAIAILSIVWLVFFRT
jgi:hypothetical protein